MKVGILRSVADFSNGGIFQYEKAFLDALSEIAPRSDATLAYLTYLHNDLRTLSRSGGLHYRGLPVQFLTKAGQKPLPAEAYLHQVPTAPPPIDPDSIYFDREGSESLKEAGVDLVLQLSPASNAFSLRLPFIMPIFDLNHRLQPEFPEVSAFGETELREYFYINTCRYATMVLVDSDIGKEHVLRFYGDYIDEERISVVPYYPPIARGARPSAEECARVAAAYDLPERYFFYPAQFWQHKNHMLILEALERLAAEGHDRISVILCGSYADYHRARHFRDVMTRIADLGLGDRVRYIGAVPERDMAALYINSVGLVMPTFFGPTNIPPFEAWHYGRPVICSDISGIREQVGAAGLLVDPRNAQGLAQAMLKVWTDPALGAGLVEAGARQLATYTWSSFVGGIEQALQASCDLVRSGRSPAFPDIVPPAPGSAI